MFFIHQTNVFNPPRSEATHIAISPNPELVAISRQDSRLKDVSQIEIRDSAFRFIHRIIVYESVSGLAWTSGKYILTVSKQATISVYDIRSGSRVKQLTTDYGPINCMNYSPKDKILFTGTEFGYVASYKIGKHLRNLSRLVKISTPIVDLDVFMKAKITNGELASKPIAQKKAMPTLKPGKRKRSNRSSDEGSDDDADEDQTSSIENIAGDCIDLHEVTIYGASQQNVVAWDYHRKTILETMSVGHEVTKLLALKNGDVAATDMGGHLSIYDHNSFTCRQRDKVFDYGALFIASNLHQSDLLIAGKGPKVALYKTNKSSRDEYVPFEQLTIGSSDATTCALFIGKSDFLVGTKDGLITRFSKAYKEGKRVLDRFKITEDFSDRLAFSVEGEVMATYGKSLTIYKLTGSKEYREAVAHDFKGDQMLQEPAKICTIRAGAYIHSATLNDRWICYSTSKHLAIHSRQDLQTVQRVSGQPIEDCHILKLSRNGKYLLAGQQKKFYVIRLNDNDTSDSTNPKTHDIQFAFKTKGLIQEMFYLEQFDKLIVICKSPRNFIYTFGMANKEPDGVTFNLVSRLDLPHSVCKAAYNDMDDKDTNLYILTSRDQLIRCDIQDAVSWDKDVLAKLSHSPPIASLPSNALGLIVLNSKECIVYYSDKMFRVTIKSGKVVGESPAYECITKVDRTVFNRPDEFLIVCAAA